MTTNGREGAADGSGKIPQACNELIRQHWLCPGLLPFLWIRHIPKCVCVCQEKDPCRSELREAL